MTLSRALIQSGALAAAAAVAPRIASAQLTQSSGKPSPIRLGLCSLPFRNFSARANDSLPQAAPHHELNAKDVKDHLPADPAAGAAAACDYKANGIKLHAAGAIYFRKNEDADVRSAV